MTIETPDKLTLKHKRSRARSQHVATPKSLDSNAIRDACRAFSPRSIELLMAIAETSKNDNARINAITTLLNRAYGRVSPAPPTTDEKPNTQIQVVFDIQKPRIDLTPLIIEEDALEPDDDA